MNKKIITTTAPITWILPFSDSKIETGLLGMTQCPGKKCQGRNHFDYNRNLFEDFKLFAEKEVKVIVCLLDKYEMRTLGVDDQLYHKFAKKLNIQVITINIIEMSVPQMKIEQLRGIMLNIIEYLNRNEKVIVHCRGGVGRAGLICGILLQMLEVFKTYEECLNYLRKKRNQNCVESQKQRDYLKSFFLKNN